MSVFLVGFRCCGDLLGSSRSRHGLDQISDPIEPCITTDHVHVDHGLTGTNHSRLRHREALVAVRTEDPLVVAKLDRLARSLPDARDIADELTRLGVALSLGGSIYDPADPVGRLLCNVLRMVAEFEADLIPARTREGIRSRKLPASSAGSSPYTPRRSTATALLPTRPTLIPRQSWQSCSTSPRHGLPRTPTSSATEAAS